MNPFERSRHPSALLLSMADAAPRAAAACVHLWARAYTRFDRDAHWLFIALKSKLGVRVRRRVRLSTGQAIDVDPFEHVGRAIARDGVYEADTVAIVKVLLQPGGVFLDVGSHVGQYTLLASQMVGPEGRVHAFEPDPHTFQTLASNVRLNRCGNVTVNERALSDTPGEAQLFLSDVASTAGNSLGRTGLSTSRSTTVVVDTLDRYVEARHIVRIDAIKADVEGAELHFLHGAADTLRRLLPLLVLEFSKHSAAFGNASGDVADLLGSWAYRIYRIGPAPLSLYEPRPSDPQHFNVLCVPESKVDHWRAQGTLAE